jgi:hypothetical protein
MIDLAARLLDRRRTTNAHNIQTLVHATIEQETLRSVGLFHLYMKRKHLSKKAATYIIGIGTW